MSPAVPLLALLMFALCDGVRRFGMPAALVSLPVAIQALAALLG